MTIRRASKLTNETTASYGVTLVGRSLYPIKRRIILFS